MSTFELIDKKLTSIEDAIVGEPASVEEIAACEAYLGVKLPPSFKEYLIKYGHLSLPPWEYLGLTGTVDFIHAGWPNFAWYTDGAFGLPSQLVVFHSREGDVLYCIDTSMPDCDGECLIVIWDNIQNVEESRLSVRFDNFLLGEVEEYLEIFADE